MDKIDIVSAHSLVLYILMRTDMDSMNPGKAVAQGSHAANQCIHDAASGSTQVHALTALWGEQTRAGFGTCIVLDVETEANLLDRIRIAKSLGLHAAVVHDPTYPVRDGAVTHLIPVTTCGYVFGPKDRAQMVIGDLALLA